MNKTYFSGGFYLTISNDPPLINDGKTHVAFDLTKYKDSFWGAPVNQVGSIEEVIETLKSWQEIDKRPEFESVYEPNRKTREMEAQFISILEKELKDCVYQA